MKKILLVFIVMNILCFDLFASVNEFSKYVSVKVGSAHLRSGPSKYNKVIKKVSKYTPLVVLLTSSDEEWYRVSDYKNTYGWINKAVVSKTASVIVKVKEAKIRKGPGFNNEVIWNAVEGVSFRCLSKKGQWLKVLDIDDETGWIFEELVWGACN